MDEPNRQTRHEAVAHWVHMRTSLLCCHTCERMWPHWATHFRVILFAPSLVAAVAALGLTTLTPVTPKQNLSSPRVLFLFVFQSGCAAHVHIRHQMEHIYLHCTCACFRGYVHTHTH